MAAYRSHDTRAFFAIRGSISRRQSGPCLRRNAQIWAYGIVDESPTDGTVDIIRRYENQISGWVSEPDKGMYDAISKGFQRTSGEIMGWINATDMLQIGGLSVVASVFRDLPQVEWITGRPTIASEQGHDGADFAASAVLTESLLSWR